MTGPLAITGKRVLVTGGLGFIGSNLAHRCVGLGADVTVYDSLDPSCGGNLANIEGIEDRIRVVRDDIRSIEPTAELLRDHDVLFNCAAYTSHAGSLADPGHAVDVNVLGTIRLLEAARRANHAIRFVQLGTSTQVGRMRKSPVTEDHPEFPLDPYSASKTAAEKYVLLYGAAFGIPVSAVRLANVYGPRASIRTPDLGFINYFVGQALRGADLTVFGKGSQLRTVTFVDDVVDALLAVAMSTACHGEVLFAAADEQHTLLELAQQIVTRIGSGQVRSVEWPKERAAIEVGDAVISSARIKDFAGWRASTSLERGLTATRDYYQPRRDRYL